MLDELGAVPPPTARSLAPGGLVDLAVTTVRVRGAVAMAHAKGRTMSSLAGRLAESGNGGQVTHRDPAGGEWTITVYPTAPSTAPMEAPGQ